MNKCVLSGNIVKDIEIKNVSVGGKDYLLVRNTLAVKRNFKNKNGEYEVDFIDFDLWGKQCEYLKNYGFKGCKVLVSGKLQCREYEDKNGKKQKVWELNLEEIEIISPREKKEEQPRQVSPFDFEQPKQEETKKQEETNYNVDPFANYNFGDLGKKVDDEIKKGKEPSYDDLPF